jgi:hypothetical protein
MEFWAEVGDGNPRYGKTEYKCLRGEIGIHRELDKSVRFLYHND